MKPLRHIMLSLWVLANIAGTAFVGLFMSALLHLRYDEMHTLGTALDPDPSLTKEQVIFNILGNGSLYVLGATLLAVLVFGINYGLFEQSTTVNARRFSMIIAVLCWLIMIVAIVFVSGHCYLKYGAKLS